MRMGTVWTIIGVIIAIVIAWFLVNLIFSVAWFILKVGLVALVAVGVFFALRALFAVRAED
jgi:hypothetical protein